MNDSTNLESPRGDRAAVYEEWITKPIRIESYLNRTIIAITGGSSIDYDQCGKFIKEAIRRHSGKAEAPLASADYHNQTQNTRLAALVRKRVEMLAHDLDEEGWGNAPGWEAVWRAEAEVLERVILGFPSVGRGPVEQPVDQVSDKPIAICSKCGRKTWSAMELGCRCDMRQPGGLSCQGTLTWVASPPVSEDSSSPAAKEQVLGETDALQAETHVLQNALPLIPLPDGLDFRNPWPTQCDMLNGPCACGAWHKLNDLKWRIEQQLYSISVISGNAALSALINKIPEANTFGTGDAYRILTNLSLAKRKLPSPAVEDVGEVEEAKSLPTATGGQP